MLASANRFWAVGPVLQLPIFDGGKREADEQKAVAEFDEAAASYRGKVLHAVREVEDNLAQIGDLGQQARDVKTAADAATAAESIAMNSYKLGAVSLLDVLTAQLDALQTKQDLQGLQTKQVEASIGLMVSLGGGWSPLAS